MVVHRRHCERFHVGTIFFLHHRADGGVIVNNCQLSETLSHKKYAKRNLKCSYRSGGENKMCFWFGGWTVSLNTWHRVRESALTTIWPDTVTNYTAGLLSHKAQRDHINHSRCDRYCWDWSEQCERRSQHLICLCVREAPLNPRFPIFPVYISFHFSLPYRRHAACRGFFTIFFYAARPDLNPERGTDPGTLEQVFSEVCSSTLWATLCLWFSSSTPSLFHSDGTTWHHNVGPGDECIFKPCK